MKRSRSKTLSPDAAARLGYFAASLTALAVVTCAGAAHRPEAPPPAPTPVAASASAAPVSAAAEPRPASAADGGAARASSFPRLRAALSTLAEKRSNEPVRILWLGDSHAAADFWPDAVRRPLQDAFGNGGPGFLSVGLGIYRHASTKLAREGKWHVQPKQPSLWLKQDDGVFGLGGMRAVPEEDARAVVELADGAVHGNARWDLAFRLPSASSRFRVVVEGGETRSIDRTTAKESTVAHVVFETSPRASVRIEQAAGKPEIFGVVVESTEPGVVVDTLGINGARFGTPLSWEAGPWIEEVARRKPALVVLAYGTNECGDAVAPFRYAPQIEALVERVRRAAPDADCLVVGPTDRAAPDWTTLPRVFEIESVERESAARLGCAYWSTFDAMGGAGSLKRWADLSPPLAAADHVHLTPRGYAEVGAAMSAFVLSSR
jgi:lysophospholipase L1-like esterase